jgi:hypothetical protein
MALIIQKRCAHCGRGTWQEFVAMTPPAPSFWRCRECGERREAPRVMVSENTLLHRGRIQAKAFCAEVSILDIGPGGAKLRLDPDIPNPLSVGERLLFNALLQPFGELSRYLPGAIRWEKGQAFGLAFAHPLSLPADDISCIIKP